MMNTAPKLIRLFVEKSGGIEEIAKLNKLLHGLPDAKRVNFMQQAVQTETGALQLMAAAMLGLAIAEEVYRVFPPSPHKQKIVV
jgi:hypothetical protein